MSDIDYYLKSIKKMVDDKLVEFLPDEQVQPENLHQAMKYAVLNGGKRIRPGLTFALGEALGVTSDKLLLIASAIELIHDYSLVHDDLPALDNDDTRRGQPSCHVRFGESTAILAGDALQSLAFEVLVKLRNTDLDAQATLKIIEFFSSAIGSLGLIGGETIDLNLESESNPSPELVKHMYMLKTAKLLQCCLVLPAMASSVNDNAEKITAISTAGIQIGISFQIHDDIIGIESNSELLGKPQGSDLEKNKPIYPVLVGMDNAKRHRDDLYQSAIKHLSTLSVDLTKLLSIFDFIVSRRY